MPTFDLNIYIWFLKIRYKKIGDEDNWFEINEHTGDLKTVKVLDRESKFVKDNQYNVSVVATDAGECNFLWDINTGYNFKEILGWNLFISKTKFHAKMFALWLLNFLDTTQFRPQCISKSMREGDEWPNFKFQGSCYLIFALDVVASCRYFIFWSRDLDYYDLKVL